MKISNLYFSYDNKPVFEDYSREIPDGIVCLMGASGLGKTTLLKLIAGLLEPDKGTIEHPYQKPAFMFQEDRLLPWRNVIDNVLLVSEDRTKAEGLLEELGINGELKISELSGGMARRVALVRTLMYDGDILLLDEPFKGMDEKLTEKAASMIIRENKPAIVATHSLQEAALLGNNIMNL